MGKLSFSDMLVRIAKIFLAYFLKYNLYYENSKIKRSNAYLALLRNSLMISILFNNSSLSFWVKVSVNSAIFFHKMPVS